VTWAIYAELCAVTQIDTFRAVRERWLDNQMWVEFTNKTVVEYAMNAIGPTIGMSAFVEKNLIQNISAVYFLNFYNMGKWTNDYVNVDWVLSFDSKKSVVVDPLISPEVFTDTGDTGFITSINDLTWSKIRLHRSEATIMITTFGSKLSARNYSDVEGTPEYLNSQIPSLIPLGYEQAQETKPTAPNRNRDPFEDLYRRLLVGEVAKSSFDRTTEILDYYIRVGEFLKEYFVISLVSINSVGLIVWVLVTTILLMKVNKMKGLWKKLLNLDVIFF
jgi:hypothetical protein